MPGVCVTALLDALGGRSDVVVHLDYETFFSSDYSLRRLTTEAYVRDPRFEVIGVGVGFGDLPPVWLEEWEFRAWAARVDWSRVTVNAHHTHFDGFILSHHYGIRPGFLTCTMSMGRALHGTVQGVSLDALSQRYGVGVKGHEVDDAKGKRRADFTQAAWLRYGAYCRNDVTLTARLLAAMMAEGFPAEELWLIDTTIRMFTEPVFRANLDVLRAALIEERTKKADFLARSGVTKETLGSSDKFATLLQSLGEEPPVKAGKRGPIFAFAKSDPGMQALLEHPRDEIRFLAEARLSVKSTIIETRTERIIGIAERGAVPFYLKYAGAHTHRWSGADKMNPQNFNRGGQLRAAIEAPPGHVLVVADSGQIEARVVGWLARQMDLLETFKRNDALGEAGDFYSDVGSTFFGMKLSKKETPVERQNSKAMVLGLGFQMGALKFGGELLKGMLGAKPVQFTAADAKRYGVSVDRFLVNREGERDEEKLGRIRRAPARIDHDAKIVHFAVADHFVRLYRRTYGKIAALWDRAARWVDLMAQEGDPAEVLARYGPLQIRRGSIMKASGLALHYPGLRRGADGYSYLKNAHERTKIYGGLLVENLVQSLARDVMAEQALWIRAAGYRVATTTHDEIVCVVPEARAEECLAFMIQAMRRPPAWCADLPLNAEGGWARSYGDCK